MNLDPRVARRVLRALWQRGLLHYKLHPGQRAIYQKIRSAPKEVQEILVFCARRWGKSTLGVLMALEDCLRTPGVTVRIVGPTIRQTVAIVEPILRKLTADAPAGLVRWTRSRDRLEVGESLLALGGFDGPNAKRHLGQECHALYLEESGATDPSRYQYVIVEVLGPQLLHSRGKKVHLTTPPVRLDHPILTDVLPTCEKRHVFFHATIFDNPLLSEGQIEDAIRESGGIESEAFQRNYLCKPVAQRQRLICPQFDPGRHVVSPTPVEGPVWLAGDLGGVRDSTVLLVGRRWGRQVQVVHEVVLDPGTPTSVIGEALMELQRRWSVQTPIVLDAPGMSLIDFLVEHKIPCVRPLKKQFLDGVMMLQKRFYSDEVVVFSSCDLLIRSLRFGTLSLNFLDFSRDDRLGHMDAVAALIYLLRIIPQVQTEASGLAHSDPLDPFLSAVRARVQQDTMRASQEAQQVAKLFKKR